MSMKSFFTGIVEHPRTVILGGVVTYLVAGWFVPKGKKRRAYYRPITSTLGGLLGVFGFIASSVRDISDAIEDGRTHVWQQAMDALKLFLQESGLETEFSATLGSEHFLPSLIVLTEVQKMVQRDRRVNLRQKPEGRAVDHKDLLLGQYYMRYTTAVYGPEMIAAAELAVLGDVPGKPSDSNQTIMARHCHLSVDDKDDKEWELWCDFDKDVTNSENNHAQNCLIVCDHKRKEVVLAIRGTFSLSGVITDLAGHASPFCGGRAHSGMADAAVATWETMWSDILEAKMKDIPKDYKIIVTGHSLGGGVANLVTILIYHRLKDLDDLKGRDIHCYAIAPPPVFAPLSAAPKAVKNTIAFVHNWDIVPSLSVDGVRRLMACIDRIAAVFDKHPLWDMAVKRFELGKPPSEVVDAYTTKVSLRTLERAPVLIVPARQLVWMEKDPTEESGEVYAPFALDPTLHAERVLDLELPDCVADHMTDKYEAAFDFILNKDD